MISLIMYFLRAQPSSVINYSSERIERGEERRGEERRGEERRDMKSDKRKFNRTESVSMNIKLTSDVQRAQLSSYFPRKHTLHNAL